MHGKSSKTVYRDTLIRVLIIPKYNVYMACSLPVLHL